MKPTSLKQHNWRRLMALWYSMAHWRILKTSLHNQYQYQCVSIDSLTKHNCIWSRKTAEADSYQRPWIRKQHQWWISKKFHRSIWYNFNEFHWWVQWTGNCCTLHTFVKTSRIMQGRGMARFPRTGIHQGGVVWGKARFLVDWNCWLCWTWIFWVLYLFWFRCDVPMFVWLHYFKLGMLWRWICLICTMSCAAKRKLGTQPLNHSKSNAIIVVSRRKIFASDMTRQPRGLSKRKRTPTIDRAWLSLKRFLPKEANKKRQKRMRRSAQPSQRKG